MFRMENNKMGLVAMRTKKNSFFLFAFSLPINIISVIFIVKLLQNLEF